MTALGTSIPSVSRVTKPAISHQPQAGGGPEMFQRAFNAVSSTHIGCSSEYATSEKFERSTGSTLTLQLQQSQSLIMEDSKGEKPNKLLVTNGVNWQNLELGNFKIEVSHSSQYVVFIKPAPLPSE